MGKYTRLSVAIVCLFAVLQATAAVRDMRAARSSRLEQRGLAPRKTLKTQPKASSSRASNRAFALGVSAMAAIPGKRVGLFTAPEIPSGGAMILSATGDFNGDGKLDLTGVLQSFDGEPVCSLSTVLHDGSAAPAPHLQSTPNNKCAPIAVGRLNGDNFDDIVFADVPATVLLSNGDGSFTAAPATIPMDGYTGSTVILLDTNNDGKRDLVYLTDTALVTRLGNGDGTFQSPANQGYEAPGVSYYDAVDLNGDGRLDLMGSENETGTPLVALAQEDGTFGDPEPYGPPPESSGAYCGLNSIDVNGDGLLDLIGANCDAQEVGVHLNLGNGTFSEPQAFDAGSTVSGTYPGDLNGDGKIDLIVVAGNEASVTVLVGNGDGTFQAPTASIATSGYWISPSLTDWDGDGVPDVVVANGYSGWNVLKGNGDGTLQGAVVYHSSLGGLEAGTSSVETADLNGDGVSDVIVGRCCGMETGVVYLGNPDGTLQEGTPFGQDNLRDIKIADFTGDGRLDLAGSSVWDATILLYPGNADGTFGDRQIFQLQSGSASPTYLHTADVNNDGKLDLLVNDPSASDVHVLINDGAGAFQVQPAISPAEMDGQEDIAVGDFNGDGNVDFIALYETWEGGAVNVPLWLGNGTGAFAASGAAISTSSHVRSAHAADVNKDGKLDLLTMSAEYPDGDMLGVHLGNGDGTFATEARFPAGGDLQWFSPGATFEVVDFDNDGNLDIAATQMWLGRISLLFGVGDGTFTSASEYATGSAPIDLAFADFNQDGAIDIVSSSAESDAVTVLLNNGASQTSVTGHSDGSFDVTVSGTFPGRTDKPSGTVRLLEDGVVVGTGTVTDGVGTAQADLAPGTHHIVAVYYSDGGFVTSASATVTVEIGSVATTTTLESSPNPASALEAVTFTIKVAPTSGTSVASGNVELMEGETLVSGGTLTNGQLTITLADFPVGSHTLTAAYKGSGGFNPSTSNALTQVIRPLATTTTLQSSKANARVGENVKLTATVTGTPGVPSGSVTFKDGDTVLGTVPLTAAATAVLNTTTLAAGEHFITAEFTGTNPWAGSASAAMSQKVLSNAADFTLTANPTTATVRYGQSAQFQIRLTPENGFYGSVSLACGALPAGMSCAFQPATLNSTGTGPVETVLTVRTAATVASAAPAQNGSKLPLFTTSLGLAFGVVLVGASRRRMAIVLTVLVIGVLLVSMAGCGDGGNSPNTPNRPIGTHSVQVSTTVVGGTGTQGVTLTLTVTE